MSLSLVAFYDNLSIRRKITFLVVALTLCVITVFSVFMYYQIRNTELRRIDAKLLDAGYGVLSMYGGEFHDRINGPESISRAEYEFAVRRLSAFANRVGLAYAYTMVASGDSVFFVTTSVPEEAMAKGELEEFYQYYPEASDNLKSAFKTGKTSFEYSSDEWGDVRSLILPVKTRSGKIFIIGADVTTASVNQTLMTVLARSLLVGAVVFLVFLLIGRVLARRLAAPITELSNAIQKLNVTDPDANKPVLERMSRIQEKAHDETSVLTGVLLNLLRTIRELLDRVQEEKASVERRVEEAVSEIESQKHYLSQSVDHMLVEMERFADGDLDVNLTTDQDDEIARLYHGFNRAVANLRLLLHDLNIAVDSTAMASEHINNSTDQLSETALAQSARAGEVAAAVEEMVVTIVENSRNALNAAAVSQENGKLAADGGEIVEKTADKIREVAEVVSSSAATVQQLGASSEQIEEIVTLISEIAGQTNLLALNAAIEAARAGEQGRGFAVVADEVRKLAERTEGATKNIVKMISTIKAETKTAVAAMERGSDEVQAGMALASQAAEALRQIVEGTQSAADMVTGIAAASEQQSSTIDHIARSIDAISRMSAQSAEAVQSIARETNDLAGLTDDLKTSTARFKATENRSSASPLLRPASFHVNSGDGHA